MGLKKIKGALAKWNARWKHEQSNWQNLNVYFKPSLTRFFISWFAAAPVLANLLEKYPSFIALPFSWWILWLASLSYAVAFFIYGVASPDFVKRYPNYPAYKAIGHSPRWIVWQFYYLWEVADESTRTKLSTRIIDKKYAVVATLDDKKLKEPQVSETGTAFQFVSQGNTYELSLNESATDAKVMDIFWEVLARWANQGQKWRNTIWILLVVSMCLVAYTVFEDISFVVSYFC